MTDGFPIVVDGVCKRFGRWRRRVDALKGVSLAVRPGQIYGLLGRNGAGKTTLVKILLGIVRPDRGDCAIEGRPSRKPSARRNVGYLPEDHRFPEYRTGEGALAFYAALSGRGGAGLERRAKELLDLMGLADAARRKIRSYSKGMKQRLGLAQALVHDPAVLFLDEPTDGVDPVGRAQIRDMLVKLRAEGKTIFLNSHLLSETERVCDRVGILEGGELVREGSIHELTETELAFAIATDRPVGPALLEGIGKVAASASPTPQGVEVRVARTRDIDAVIDALRAAGVGIRGLSAVKVTLEEVFLKVVDGKGGSAG